jgi:hypothetical protein
VWEIASVFVHVTVVPTATFSWSGVKARSPKEAAPTGIETDVDDPPGVGAGVGVGDGVGEGAVEGDELLPPQAAANARSADKTARRNDDIRTSEHEAVKRALHCS